MPKLAIRSEPYWTLHEVGATLYLGDCNAWLPRLAAASVDAVVTDPPYGLVEPRSQSNPAGAFAPRTDEGKVRRRGGFMGKAWDAAVPGPDVWAEVLRVLRPGGYMLTMGGTRTYHRLACAVEDAGFEVRDCLMWIYGSGFPKGKGCLKPAVEPILLCRKPGPKVLPLGIDVCRVAGGPRRLIDATANKITGEGRFGTMAGSKAAGETTAGRWPANVAHDGSDEVLEAFAAFGERSGDRPGRKVRVSNGFGANFMDDNWQPPGDVEGAGYADTGTAARFFYTAKASKRERGEGNNHPTVKPLALFRWLIKLVTPPGGLVLDPFVGSGTTGEAAVEEGFRFTGIDKEREYLDIAKTRIICGWAGREGPRELVGFNSAPVTW